MKQTLLLFLISTINLAQLPENKYHSDRGQKHKDRSAGLTLSLGYPVISQFLNPIFATANQAGQMKKAGTNLSFYADFNTPKLYPFSLQIGGYSGAFQPADNLTFSNGAAGKDLEVSHDLFEVFVCSKILPNRSRFLPYIGVGYIDGGLKLGKRGDTSKDKAILSAIKIQSPAWKLGMTVEVTDVVGSGGMGLMVEYMQPFQISGLLPGTFYAASRLQVGIFMRYN